MTDEERRDEIARRMAGPEWDKQREVLTNPLLRLLIRAVGIDLTDIDRQHREVKRDLAALLQAAIWFSEFGWYVSASNLRASDYTEAVEAWKATPDPDLVDERLTRAWHDLIWLRHSYGPIVKLAGRHQPTRDVMLARLHTMDKAVTHHMNGDYEASTLIVLTQVDGLTFDFTEGAHGFFYRGKDHFFEDDTTLAGMPEFLRAVRKAVNRDINRTSDSTAFHRNAIVHGRYTSFGTETNSAKAFALMSGVIEWLEPKTGPLTEKWRAAHEAKYAGSKERDAEGRLLDQRGFEETRDWLEWLAIRESNEHRTNGRYNADLRGMFPAEGIERTKRRDRTTLTVAPDGQSWWASCPSDTAVHFGIGAKSGEPMSWLYADESPPGPLGQDARWVYQMDDDPPPDWDY